MTLPMFHKYFFFENYTNDFVDIVPGMTIDDITAIYGLPTGDGQDDYQGGYYKFGDIAVVHSTRLTKLRLIQVKESLKLKFLNSTVSRLNSLMKNRWTTCSSTIVIK